MATEYYKADGTVMRQVEQLIRADHPDLVEVIDRILVIFRDPGAKEGGRPVLGKHGKVSDRSNIVGGTNYVFFMELNAESWASDLDTTQKEALLFHHLSGMGSEENEKTGETKFILRPPDVVGYVEEFERYGLAWRPQFEEEPLPPLENNPMPAIVKAPEQKANVDLITIGDLPSSVRADALD